MAEPAVGAGAEGWKLSTRRAAEGELEIVLGGRWNLRDSLPSASDLEGDLAAGVKRLRLSAAGLEDWDSGLPTFLAGVLKLAAERGIATDAGGLPDGVQRLIAMAFAVPEQRIGDRQGASGGLLTLVGLAVLELARGAPEMLRFLGEILQSAGRLVTGRARFRRADLWLEIEAVGPKALPVVSVIAFLIGLILAYLGADQLRMVGAQIFIADLVAIGMVREVGALMTGIIVAGRSGAAFAARLGTMQVNEEIDALRTLGISPVDFLVLPRLLALVMMVPLLTLYAGVVGILAGLLVALLVFGIGVFEYYTETLRALTLTHIWVGVSKGTAYGAVVAFAGCLRGMQCGRSAEAVGVATTSAVVTGILLITVVASVMTIVYYRLGI